MTTTKAGATHSDDAIFEEREEFMISPSVDSTPVLRKTHFLKPTLASIHEKSPVLNKYFSVPRSFGIKNCPVEVHFDGWRSLQHVWRSWVNRLIPIHEKIWQKSGIYDAILSTTFRIKKHDDGLILAFAEKWCPETNTFIFPWGEATITLEDMMIIGGFSVLGEPVSNPFGTKIMLKPEDYEIKTRKRIKQSTWLKQFYDCGNEFEHEAFLVLWLSRYVFTDSYDHIRKSLYPMASCLARGIKVALAPAVLASIYRDLSLLKAAIVASSSCLDSTNDEDDYHLPVIKLHAPFQLVQVWIWERFLELRPVPNTILLGEPITGKWHDIKKLKITNVRLALDSAENAFVWRPYKTGLHGYINRDRSKLVDSDLDEDDHSFARCIRVSELVGLDNTIEQYLPNRVAMQFGIHQDLPGHVARLNESVEMAWDNYTRPIYDLHLYIPAQNFKAGVTTRYLEWWKPLLFDRPDPIKGTVFRKKRSSRQALSLRRLKDGKMPNAPPGFRLKHKKGPVNIMDNPPLPPLDVTDSVVSGFRLQPKTRLLGRVKDICSPPPVFTPNYKRVKLVGNSPILSWKPERLKVPTHQTQPPSSAVICPEHEHDAEDMSRSVSSIQSRYSLFDGSTDVVVNDEAVRVPEGDEVDNGSVDGACCCVHEIKVPELISRISKLEQELQSLKSASRV